MQSENLTVSVAVVGRDRYILFFADAQKTAALRQLGKWACNSELNFGWKDAAIMALDIRGGIDGDDNLRNVRRAV